MDTWKEWMGKEWQKLFNCFDNNPKTQITWVTEVKADLEEMKITKEEVEDRGQNCPGESGEKERRSMNRRETGAAARKDEKILEEEKEEGG